MVCDGVEGCCMYGGMIDFMLFGGFGNGLTDERTDIGGCRVAFATENHV